MLFDWLWLGNFDSVNTIFMDFVKVLNEEKCILIYVKVWHALMEISQSAGIDTINTGKCKQIHMEFWWEPLMIRLRKFL